MDSYGEELKLQVNIIRFSKYLKNPFQLKEKTGMNMYNIHHILKNKDTILKQWREYLSTYFMSSTHADDCYGIDNLLVEWVRHCRNHKEKLGTLEITRQLINLTNVLKMSSYYHIKQNIWNRIEEILEQKLLKRIKKPICEPYTLLEFFMNHGWRLMQPQTYEKFFQIINDSALDLSKDVFNEENIEENISGGHKNETQYLDASNHQTLNIHRTTYLGKETEIISTRSTTYNPQVPAEKLVSKSECTIVPIKEGLLKGTSDKTNLYNSNPVFAETEIHNHIKREKVIESHEEVKHDTDSMLKEEKVVDLAAEGKEDPDLIIIQEPNDIVEILESDDEDNNIVDKSAFKCSPVPHIEVKEESLLIVDNGICNKKIKVENCDGEHIHGDDIKENDLKKPVENLDDDSDDEIQIVFEIEDTDEDVNNELMEIINKYDNENPKQEHIKTEQPDMEEEFIDEPVPAKQTNATAVSVLCREEPGTISHSQTFSKQHLENMKRTALEVTCSNLSIKRTRSNMENNLPSTSTSISDVTSSEYLTRLCIKNNLEAYKCLHLVKDFFEFQADEVGSKLVKSLMTSFLSSYNALEER